MLNDIKIGDAYSCTGKTLYVVEIFPLYDEKGRSKEIYRLCEASVRTYFSEIHHFYLDYEIDELKKK